MRAARFRAKDMMAFSVFSMPRPGQHRARQWKANMTLRHCWFRILLHLAGMLRRPRNIPWHWRHIVRELYDR